MTNQRENLDSSGEQQAPGWIPVDVRLPEKSGPYRVRSQAGDKLRAYFSSDTEPHWIKRFWGDPTHWTELSLPPKERER